MIHDGIVERYEGFGISPTVLRENYSEIIRLMNNDSEIPAIFIKWTIADINDCALRMAPSVKLNKHQCESVLYYLQKYRNCETGITWNIIEYWIGFIKNKK